MADKTYLDWPFFEDSHRTLARDLGVWVGREVAKLAEHGHGVEEVDEACRRLVAALGADGWLGYAVPASHGGHLETLDVRSLCIIRETLARESGLADFGFAMQGLGSAPISLFGGEELKQAYLPKVAAGSHLAAFALTEPESGSDVAAMTTTARRDGNHFVIDGAKTFISNGGIAGHYVVFARTGEADGARGISAFVVEPEAPGFSVAERIEVIAPHPLATIEFKDCRVPASQMLGQGGDGFKIAMATLDIFRSTVAAAALGFARRALDEAIARAQSRQAFGQKIAEFQLIQAKIADMAVKIDAAALLVYRSAWTKDVLGVRVTRESAIAKLYATEAAQEVIDQAVQIFGGAGVVSGVMVEQLYRDIRALRIYEGTSEIQKLVIARQTFDAAARDGG